MIQTNGYAAKNPTSPLEPYSFERRDPGPQDVLIEILFCGICHSDIHQVRDEWGFSKFPMVPGHEIVGKIVQKGKKVSRFKIGENVGVGCFIDSCRKCIPCKKGEEQYCSEGFIGTYNSTERDGKTPTYGGYSSQIVVDQKYVLKIPKNLPLDKTAPLLCAGITTYSPLKHWKVKKGTRLGVIGLGGLGHMAVKLGAAMGAEVTVLSTSASKEKDAKKLGAKNFIVTREESAFEKYQGYFDLILNTISAPHEYTPYLNLLNTNGTMVLLGVPPQPSPIEAFPLILKRRTLAGSLIGGIKETQEMLHFCGKKKITSEIETIAIQEVNHAYERMLKSDVKYRFVIDLKTLK